MRWRAAAGAATMLWGCSSAAREAGGGLFNGLAPASRNWAAGSHPATWMLESASTAKPLRLLQNEVPALPSGAPSHPLSRSYEEGANVSERRELLDAACQLGLLRE